MPDNNLSSQAGCVGNAFKEAVSINAGRIYDSCSDKDCIDHLQVFFTDTMQAKIDEASSVKCRNVRVIDVFMDVQSVPFNKGFYSVDMTFFFNVELDVYQMPCLTPSTVNGLSIFTKKVILYGSEGNVNVFTSDTTCSPIPANTYNAEPAPRATVQVVQPICLSCKLLECCPCKECSANIPMAIAGHFDGCFCPIMVNKTVEITLGVFSIVSLERTVQMMIPVYDYSIPEKECTPNHDDPCELFRRIKFPVNEFFPPRMQADDDFEENGCGRNADFDYESNCCD